MDGASPSREDISRAAMVSRRALIAGSLAAALSGCVTARAGGRASSAQMRRWHEAYGVIHDQEFTIPAVSMRDISTVYLRQEVDYATRAVPGSIVVDPQTKFLYLVQGRGMARRYGIGVGREGYGWSGYARVGDKKRWPTWTPPQEMIVREPWLAEFEDGMPPGLDNPLGARALYLHADGRDTLYRLHGTGNPRSIGTAVSSGCIRLLHHDIIDLYNRVDVGTQVVVLGPGVVA
jgi:lipoprotein-anchoring transpeptidase ErfK/SrfK